MKRSDRLDEEGDPASGELFDVEFGPLQVRL
jgi:hypothetical protein